jgi:serine/threonine protein phosphatase PrpC
MRYKAAYHTDVGIRKKTNQDSLAIKIADTPYGMAAFAVICDGMGGLAKGEVASKEVICAFSDWFQESFAEMIDNDSFDEELMRKQWHSIAVNENEILKAYGEDNGIMIGTTLTAMLMFRDSYYIIHVGDSRAYEITGTEARQLTNDQTFVAREVAAGRMTPEQEFVEVYTLEDKGTDLEKYVFKGMIRLLYDDVKPSIDSKELVSTLTAGNDEAATGLLAASVSVARLTYVAPSLTLM